MKFVRAALLCVAAQAEGSLRAATISAAKPPPIPEWGPQHEPFEVDPQLQTLEAEATGHRERDYQMKAVAAALESRAAASQTEGDMSRVKLLAARNAIKTDHLHRMDAQAEQAVLDTVAEGHKAKNALKSVEEIAKTAKEDAATLAVTKTQQALLDSFKNLEAWRNKVLSNPSQKAKKAGQEAAEPFFKTIETFRARMGQYALEASTLDGQARAAASGANGVMAGAQGKMNSGDVISAKADVELAKAMQAQGNQLAGAAKALDNQVQEMNNMIPHYISAAHQAAWAAEARADPDGIPPPPMDPHFSYTPPPPPA